MQFYFFLQKIVADCWSLINAKAGGDLRAVIGWELADFVGKISKLLYYRFSKLNFLAFEPRKQESLTQALMQAN